MSLTAIRGVALMVLLNLALITSMRSSSIRFIASKPLNMRPLYSFITKDTSDVSLDASIDRKDRDRYQEILRQETIMSFDTQRHDLLTAIKNILEINAGEKISDFQQLHTMKVLGETTIDHAGIIVSKQQMIWNKERGRLNQECVRKYEEFDYVYKAFIEQFIGPYMGGGRILYQRAPTLRIMFPSSMATTVMHNDKDYHHQPSEVNYWLPITPTWGNNSLWLESGPDRGDWHSLTMKYGQVCRFYGNLCRHYTNPNNSGVTRVSIDFRAVSSYSGEHDPRFDRGVPRGSKAKYAKVFDIGGYYNVTTIPNDPKRIDYAWKNV